MRKLLPAGVAAVAAVALLGAPHPANAAPAAPEGFASVAGLGLSGTTGGAAGPTVTVTTGADLARYAGANTPYTIMVAGRLTVSDMITVVANKSIIGVGSTAEITGGGLQLGSTTRPGNNVIIRNIRFSGASDDSVSVTNSAHHVWIDHNEFLPAYDGSLDIKRRSTFVTVSWNRFRGTDKTMLVGHSDNYPSDVGYLKVTYHHNYFDGSNQRHPRVRFGEPVHVFNNYYRNIGLYGIASTENAGVVAEGNYFENVPFPCHSVTGYAESAPGRLVQRLNAFANSGPCEAGGTVTEPSTFYPYRLDAASAVPSIVTAGAGVGRL
ncbi:MAG TPA: pectate lyase [Actinoplanes sp.]|jgi:pectate lyase